ncbi:MAG: Glu/Leu/Phe/Val dehydrogenase [Patescibacteria group bacterium]
MKAIHSGVCVECRARLHPIAEKLRLSPIARAILEHPQRTIGVSIPLTMDNGSIRVFDGFRVQYNDALGPTKGGIRYHEGVGEDEVKELAFLMTIKNSLAGLPYGGGKGGITVNPKELSQNELERLTRGFVRALGTTVGPYTDVPAPDVNTTPEMMGWFADEYAKVVGKPMPAVVTGKPVDKGGSRGRDVATGLGGAYILDQYAVQEGWKPTECKVAIQGFGNVGGHIAHLLVERGYTVVAVSNSRGGVYRDTGFSAHELLEAQKNKTLPTGEEKTNADILTLPVQILIPAALSDQITRDNANDIQAKLVLEMANAPTSVEADAILFDRGIKVVPDILANSGGVIVSYFEWVQNLQGESWSEEDVAKKLKEKMTTAFGAVMARAQKDAVDMRTASYFIAIERVLEAEKKRGRV